MRCTTRCSPPGVERIRAGARATVAWSVENPALAQLLRWRPVPGFAPSSETFQPSVDDMGELRAELAEAVSRREVTEAAAGPDAVRLFTVVMSGLISQQLARTSLARRTSREPSIG